ncbi:MAG: alpha/beta hydrolase [Rhizobiaceae bacterium]
MNEQTATASKSTHSAEPLSKGTQEKAQLYATEDNPIPDGASVGLLHTSDGAVIRFARWETKKRPSKGTVLLLHGRTEYIEKYFETIIELRERGFGVLTFDWRGQGGSSRLLRDARKGHVDNFNQYLIDFEAVLTEIVLPDCASPYYVVGHSTGSLIALMAAPALTNRIRRMVLLAPLFELNNLPMRQSVLQRLLGILTFAGFGRAYLSQNRKSYDEKPFLDNKLTSDEKRFQRSRDFLAKYPHLGISGPTIAWLFAACRAMAQVNAPEYCNAISIPTLLIGAGNDAVVSPSAIEAYGHKMRSGAFLTITGAKHEILQEQDVFREQLLAAFDAFVPGTEI